MIERSGATAVFLIAVREELPKRLPPYRRTTSQERSREMQKAAFRGERKVTLGEFNSLIEAVRAIRPWMIAHGELTTTFPDGETAIPAYSRQDLEGPNFFRMEVILKPHEQSAGRNREPYPKFTFEVKGEDIVVNFDLNFNNTYNLSVRVPGVPKPYEITELNRANMRKPEHDLVMNCIGELVSHFGIPLL